MASRERLSTPPTSIVIPDIVEQHAEEAAFLWRQRDMATDQPQFTLRQLAKLEERIEAHIDGLRVAESAGLSIALGQLKESQEDGALFTVATLILERHDGANVKRLLDFAEAAPKSARGLFGAIGWVAPDALRGLAIDWFDAPSSFWRLVGVVACSLHRVDPSSRLDRLLADQPAVRARALRLAGELGRTDLKEHVREALADEDTACRFWAAWSAGILGDRAAAIPVLQNHAVADGRFKWLALDLVLRLMEHQAAISWLRGLGREPKHTRRLVVAAGVLGDPVVLPWLVQQMSVEALARVAGESFSMITGVDLSEHGLDGKAPETFEADPTDEPSDENVAMDADENLAWPDQSKVHSWWQKEKHRFTQGVRHLRGVPITEQSCNEVLRDGYQRQRRAAAYELALLGDRCVLWNWRARSASQAKSLPAPLSGYVAG
jgi:uncharacterized protein (TIGR02270 family)